MATASSSLHQPIFPQYPSLSRSSRFHPPLRLSSLRFPSRIRASSAVALEPLPLDLEWNSTLGNGMEWNTTLGSNEIPYLGMTWKGRKDR
ncbi:hypothetical protein CK203_020129 [Vitis vinifera]|uniref:Uncharacterized protein n=1 Tax=Vitis vinifera TaxID=29760 RepID=A0A438J8K2_VITVI|nr:hypothetical protein CK203_074103 [Vitis vinifera]RVX05295.1 hypothetical protein CK203_020129 [Vitis vinifera]